MDDLASRLANRVQLSSDGRKPYLKAVEGAFGVDIDYAVIQQICGTGVDPYGALNGWYGDHGREETAGNTDDEFLTWNYASCTDNNDGPAVSATTASYPFHCCW